MACLSSLPPLRPFVLELDAAGELAFAGSRWRGVMGPEGTTTPLGFQMVGDACLFVRAGDVVEAQWADEALRVLAQNPRVGAVGGWLRKHSGIESTSCLYIPELAELDDAVGKNGQTWRDTARTMQASFSRPMASGGYWNPATGYPIAWKRASAAWPRRSTASPDGNDGPPVAARVQKAIDRLARFSRA